MFIIRLFYVILLIACVIFYIMYLWDFALVLLITMIVVPIVMFITLLITKCNIGVDFLTNSNTVQKNQGFPVQIRIINRSFFPVGKAEANIEYCNIFNNEITSFVLHMPIQARNEQNAVFQLNSKFCGILNIHCAGITIYDPLKLFKFTVGKNRNLRIAVMPEGHEINGQVCYTDRVNEESNIFSEHKPGDDPSEVFDLRGYVPGDKLNRIHWKLSSKKDEFIVKDYSLPIDVPCSVFLDLRCSSPTQVALPVFDTLLESLLSISQFLIENEKAHSIIYYNFEKQDFCEVTIIDMDSLAIAVKSIINSINSADLCRPALDYFVDERDLSLSSFVYISSETDDETLAHIDEKIDADLKNAFIVVSSQDNIKELLDSLSNINIIPVVIGKISSSITDIEV